MHDTFTVSEAARILGVHRSRVWVLVRDGRIKATRAGPIWLIERADLDRYRALPPAPPGRKRG